MSIDAPTTETPKKEIPVTRIHAHDKGYISEEDFKKKEQEDKDREEAEKKIADGVALKKAQFEKDPDMFIHVDDIIVAALRAEHGFGIAIGRCQRPEMEMCLTRLQYKVYQLFQDLDMKAMLIAKQSGILTPPEAGKIIT